MLPHLPRRVWPPGAARQDVFARLARRPTRPARRPAPYLLVVEDAHWADEATLDLMGSSPGASTGCRALVLVTYRPEDAAGGSRPANPAGRHGIRHRDRRVDLPPLTPGCRESRSSRSTRASIPRRRAPTRPGCSGSPAATPSSSPRPLSAGDRAAADHACVTPCSPGWPGSTRTPQRALEVVALAGPAPRPACSSTCSPTASPRSTSRSTEVCCARSTASWCSGTSSPAARWPRGARGPLGAHAPAPPRGAHRRVPAPTPPCSRTTPRRRATRTPCWPSRRRRRRARPSWARTGRPCAQYRRALRHADRLPDAQRAELLWPLGYECYLTDCTSRRRSRAREAPRSGTPPARACGVGDA